MNKKIISFFRLTFVTSAIILTFFFLLIFCLIFFLHFITISCDLFGYDFGNSFWCRPGDPGGREVLAILPTFAAAIILTALTVNSFKSSWKIKKLKIVLLITIIWLLVFVFGTLSYKSMSDRSAQLEPKILVKLTSHTNNIELNKPITLYLNIRNIDTRELSVRLRRGCSSFLQRDDQRSNYIFDIGATCSSASYESITLKPGASFSDEIVYSLLSPVAGEKISLTIFESAEFEDRIGSSTGRIELKVITR
jgi:hypothetical protein